MAVEDRILALDVGRKRIGLAISGPLGITALGLPTLHRTRIREDLAHLKAVVEERSITTLLIGRPLHMSGEESRQSEYTREFAERLSQYLGIPIVYWDERLTTAEANRLMRDNGASLEQRKQAVDQMSAILILESYLGHQSLNSPHA